MKVEPIVGGRVTLATLRAAKAAGRKFPMLTAYDYPTAALAQAAGVQVLLIGDSLGTVLLGQPNTRQVPLTLMLILGEAVRRGAPHVYLVGDLPYETLNSGPDVAVMAARRYRDEARCDAVKLEVGAEDDVLVRAIADAGIDAIAHLGLRPQQVTAPEDYRAQARDATGIEQLVQTSRRMVDAGAVMLLLEAVPPEASAAVVASVEVPVIGCGAGPACDGHVVVTQDMLGLGTIKPPRFVPVLAQIGPQAAEAMRQYVLDIEGGRYPGAQHVYSLRAAPAASR